MNTSNIPQYIVRFLIFMIAQAWIFNNLDLLGFINPAIYIMFILILPIDIKLPALLLLGFFTGLIQDMLINTGGIHAFATTAIAYIRGLMLQNAKSARDAGAGSSPSATLLGWRWYISYASLLIFSHAFIVATFDIFAFRVLPILVQTISDGATALLLILGAEFLFRRNPSLPRT